ncbi:MAG TPA: FecR domain-containing protein [Rhodanobacteraceae bacterium]|nr:FecR domain-containing protein [Rhodanobacteraceae bacterium]
MTRANDIARRQAADWFARLLAPDASPRDHDAFERWCAESDANADAYAAVAADHELARLLADDPMIAAATRKARIAYAGHGRTGGLRRYAALAAAAIVVVAAGAFAWRLYRDAPRAEALATAVGEQRTVVLADGTRLVLDTDTRLDTRFGGAARELVLHQGRIDIDVGRDARPFSVASGRGVVRDVGTRFEVERRGEDVAVTLMSGAVNVSLPEVAGAGEATLAPGQQARFGATGGIVVAETADIGTAARWTEGTLVFKERRLGDLIAEVNRYSTVQIRLADDSLADLRVSGVFRVGDQAGLLEALRTGWSISTKQTSDREILLLRK